MKKRKFINILFVLNSSVYRFGDGKIFKATKKTQLPANLGGHQVMIELT